MKSFLYKAPIIVGFLLMMPAASIAQSFTISGDKAMDLISKIPEVIQWGNGIDTLSHGDVKMGLMVDNQPNDDKPFFSIRVFENHKEYIISWQWFEVDANTGIIYGKNDYGEQIPLSKWKEWYKKNY